MTDEPPGEDAARIVADWAPVSHEKLRAEYAARIVADWRPLTEEQLGRIAALLRTDPATSGPEQDRGVDPLAS